MSDRPDTPTVVGVRPKITRWNVIYLISIGCLYIGWGIAKGIYQLPILAILFAVAFGLQAVRPPTVVSAGGIRRPWRPRGVVGWNEVDAVVSPTIGLPGVRLQLTSGKVLVLSDIPSEKSPEVAALGGKPIQRMPIPRSRTVSSPQQDPTPMEMEADVERRASALAEERRRMEAVQRWSGGPPS